jgi:hypothetical protein
MAIIDPTDEIDLQILNIWIEVSRLRAQVREQTPLCTAAPYPRGTKRSGARRGRRQPLSRHELRRRRRT